MAGIVVLTRCEYHFIRVHENLVQYSSDDISIVYRDTHSCCREGDRTYILNYRVASLLK